MVAGTDKCFPPCQVKMYGKSAKIIPGIIPIAKAEISLAGS